MDINILPGFRIEMFIRIVLRPEHYTRVGDDFCKEANEVFIVPQDYAKSAKRTNPFKYRQEYTASTAGLAQTLWNTNISESERCLSTVASTSRCHAVASLIPLRNQPG